MFRAWLDECTDRDPNSWEASCCLFAAGLYGPNDRASISGRHKAVSERGWKGGAFSTGGRGARAQEAIRECG